MPISTVHHWATGITFTLLLAAVASGWSYRRTLERVRSRSSRSAGAGSGGARRTRTAPPTTAPTRSAVSRFGELSAAFTLQVLFPKLVIVVGFDVFAAERERGTLRQLRPCLRPYRAQDAVRQTACLAAPLRAAQSLFHALAGRDFEHRPAVRVAAEDQRRVIQKLMNREVTLQNRKDRPD
jgi:hypothetical protein